jgi:hypothetical protein
MIEYISNDYDQEPEEKLRIFFNSFEGITIINESNRDESIDITMNQAEDLIVILKQMINQWQDQQKPD